MILYIFWITLRRSHVKKFKSVQVAACQIELKLECSGNTPIENKNMYNIHENSTKWGEPVSQEKK